MRKLYHQQSIIDPLQAYMIKSRISGLQEALRQMENQIKELTRELVHLAQSNDQEEIDFPDFPQNGTWKDTLGYITQYAFKYSKEPMNSTGLAQAYCFEMGISDPEEQEKIRARIASVVKRLSDQGVFTKFKHTDMAKYAFVNSSWLDQFNQVKPQYQEFVGPYVPA